MYNVIGQVNLHAIPHIVLFVVRVIFSLDSI